jgi:hypothetical protein
MFFPLLPLSPQYPQTPWSFKPSSFEIDIVLDKCYVCHRTYEDSFLEIPGLDKISCCFIRILGMEKYDGEDSKVSCNHRLESVQASPCP